MLNLVQADLFKLGKSLAIKILFGITTVSAAVMTAIAYLIPQGKVDASLTGIGFMFSDINVISIIGGIVAGVALGTGYQFSMGSAAVGFLNLLTAQGAAAISASEVWKLLAVMLILAIVYIAQLSICVPLSFMLKKPIFVVGIYYGISILSGQLLRLSESYPALDRMLSLTPFGGKYAFITLDTAAVDMLKAVAVSLIFISVMLGITYGPFKKLEIK